MSNYQGPVARILGGDIDNALLGAASIICRGARVHRSIIRREAVVETGAKLENCIIMDYACIGRGCKLCIECVGIYPVGSLVELTTGEVGIVISVNSSARLRPMVDLLLDANKKPYYPTTLRVC